MQNSGEKREGEPAQSDFDLTHLMTMGKVHQQLDREQHTACVTLITILSRSGKQRVLEKEGIKIHCNCEKSKLDFIHIT
jgi:hypothetical protein